MWSLLRFYLCPVCDLRGLYLEGITGGSWRGYAKGWRCRYCHSEVPLEEHPLPAPPPPRDQDRFAFEDAQPIETPADLQELHSASETLT
jgi:hypothetical protein